MANYTIEARSLDIVGGAASHNFWVLRDDTGKVISELHGLATNRDTGHYEPIGTDEDLYSLRIWQFNKAMYTEAGQDFKIVYSDSSSKVLEKWNTAVASINYINHFDLDYPTLGVSPFSGTINSNSSFRTLGEIMRLPIIDFSGVVEPGLDNRMITPQQIENLRLHSDNLYNSLNPENQQIVAAMWNETTNGTTITLEDGQTIYLTSTSLEGLGNVISGTRLSPNGVTETTNSYFTGVDGTLLGNIKGYDPANGDTTLQMLQNTTSALLEAFQGSVTQSTLIAAGVATSPFAYKDSLFGDYGFYTQDDSSYGLMNETGYWDYAKGDFTSWTDGGNFANNYGFDTLGDNYAYLNGFDNYGGCVA